MTDTIAYRDLFLEELDEYKEAQATMHRLLTTTTLTTSSRLIAVMTLHLQQTKLHIDRLEWIVHLFRESAGFGLADSPDGSPHAKSA